MLLAALLAAPVGETSRFPPSGVAQCAVPPRLILEDDQVDAEAFPLFTEADLGLVHTLAWLDAPEAERLR